MCKFHPFSRMLFAPDLLVMGFFETLHKHVVVTNGATSYFVVLIFVLRFPFISTTGTENYFILSKPNIMSKRIIYSFACLCFCIVIGGAVYEHLAVVPRWSAAPPASLSMFQGDYGLNPGIFWMLVHPVSLLFFLLTIIVNWRSSSRKNILFTLIGYLVVLAITAYYFVPELMALINTPYAETVNANLVERAKMWELLSIIRLGFLLILAIVFLMGLAKTEVVVATVRGKNEKKLAVAVE